MNRSELYDTLVSLDEKYTEEAESFFTNKGDFTMNAQCNKIKTTRLTAVAASIIAIICTMAIILSLVVFNSGNSLKNDFNAGVGFKTRTISSSSIETSGGVYKEIPTDFSFITIPATVSNNSSFTMQCAFGVDAESWMFTYDKYLPELVEKGINAGDQYDFSIYVENRVFESSSYLEESDIIFFFNNSGYYKQYISYEQLNSDFKFDARCVLSQDGTVVFSNIENSNSLPFHWTVPVRIDLLDRGTKGLLSAGFLSESKIGHDRSGNVSLIYYYCSGEYVGFGTTEEEAFQNSLDYEENNDDIVGMAYCAKNIDDAAKEAAKTEYCFCDSYMYLYPIESNDSEFDKNQRVTLAFEVQNDWCSGKFDLTFDSENIYEPSYRTFNNDKKEYCEISFRADPYKNGRIKVDICPKIKEDVDVIPCKSITLYTSNSLSKTYLSAASMETAMAMAGQEIDSGMICDCDTVIDESDLTRAAPITVRGIIKWTDYNNGLHPAKNITVDIYRITSGSGNVSIASTTTDSSGAYEAVFISSPTDSYNVYCLFRLNGSNVVLCDITGNERSYLTPTSYGVTSGQQVVKSYTFPNNTDLGKAASIQQGIALASEYIKTLEGHYYAAIDVLYPYTGISNYNGSQILIGTDDAFDWDVIEHEYGHYVEDTVGINLIGGKHSSTVNLEDWTDYPRTKDQAVSVAWTEGWATYFAINLQKEMNAISLNIPNVGDSYYTDTIDNSLNYDIEILLDPRIKGEGNEASIAAALYDLTDAYNSLDYDYVYCASSTIWSILKENLCNNFSEFVSSFYNSTYGTITKLNYGSTLTHLKMASSLNSPTGTNGSTPYFYWTPQGGSINYPNNKYNLCFYNSSYTKVLSINNLTADHITLTANQWNSVKQQCGATIYCCVETYQSNPTQTGPYYSNLISIDNPNYSK